MVCWFLYPQVFDVLVDPYCNLQGATVGDCRLLQTEPLEVFSMRLKIAGYGGIALAMPVLLWQLCRFVVPALHPNEKRWAYPFVGSALVLFVLGAALAFHTLTPTHRAADRAHPDTGPVSSPRRSDQFTSGPPALGLTSRSASYGRQGQQQPNRFPRMEESP